MALSRPVLHLVIWIMSAITALALALALFSTSRFELWHTRSLSAEFGAGFDREVSDFAAYLELEERVFAQLDARIYAHTPTGLEFSLLRYSSGSIADPRGLEPDWNRSFELGVGNARGGVLLLHGMSDSPYSLRALGEHLAAQGFRVLGLRMPGHGTIPSGLASVHWQDMAAVTRIGMQHLLRELDGAPVYMVGYSTGAALALDFALQAEAEELPAGLVLISPAIGITPAAALASWKRLLSYVPGLRKLAWSDLALEFDPYKYNSFATNAAEQVHLVTRAVHRRIQQDADAAERLPPTLVLMSAVDATVSIDAVVDRLLLQMAPGRHELVIFDINRLAPMVSMMREDPGPITRRLLEDETLPFAVTLVGNAGSDSRAVIAAHKAPFSGAPASSESLGVNWPPGVFSLSHVALPFPTDDPLYGRHPPEDPNKMFLGYQSIQGERGVLTISASFFQRLRHNPFYDYLEQRVTAWLDHAPDQ